MPTTSKVSAQPVKQPAAKRPSTAAAKKTTRTRSTAAKRRTPAPKHTPTPSPRSPVAAPKRAAAKPLKAEQAAKPGKDKNAKALEKVKKPKLVRDSFTIPKAEYEALAALKARAAKQGQTPKKSELLRAGIMALTGMSEAQFIKSLQAVPAIKTGRPAR